MAIATQKVGRRKLLSFSDINCLNFIVFTTYVHWPASPFLGSLGIVRGVRPHDVNLADEDNQTDEHSNRNDRQVDACKFQTADMDVFSAQDIAPKHAC